MNWRALVFAIGVWGCGGTDESPGASIPALDVVWKPCNLITEPCDLDTSGCLNPANDAECATVAVPARYVTRDPRGALDTSCASQMQPPAFAGAAAPADMFFGTTDFWQ
jgi:hypothetical protein